MKLTILYRGPLSSCNYGCAYCPFAKRHETREELAADERALERFANWARERHVEELSVFFTPWGEALVRRWYQRAIASLSRLPHVRKVAIQTNLSCRLDWLDECDLSRVGLWTTYHPSEVSRERFVSQCRELDGRGARYSVGVVGLKEHEGEIKSLRRELRPEVYMWINAFKDRPDYHDEELVAQFTEVDPFFPINLTDHPSQGRACRAGESVISVDGEGVMRRCHFIREPIGNLYDSGFERTLRARLCTQTVCGCHIGYVHLHHLGLYDVFGDGVLERITANSPKQPEPRGD